MPGSMAGKLYVHHERASVFSTWKALQAAARYSNIGKTAGELIAWLEAQDTFTLHRPVRKIFPRNPYSVNIMGTWECDLVYEQGSENITMGSSIYLAL